MYTFVKASEGTYPRKMLEECTRKGMYCRCLSSSSAERKTSTRDAAIGDMGSATAGSVRIRLIPPWPCQSYVSTVCGYVSM